MTLKDLYVIMYIIYRGKFKVLKRVLLSGIIGFPLDNPLNASKVAPVPVPTLSEMTRAFLSDTAPTSSDIITIVIGGDDVRPLRLPIPYVHSSGIINELLEKPVHCRLHGQDMLVVCMQLLQAVFGPRGSPIQMSQYSTFVTSIVEAYTTALRTLYEAGARKFIITVSSGTLTPSYNIECCSLAPCKRIIYCRGCSRPTIAF